MSTRYPVILNGDHAEFEAEWAGRDPKERPDWPLPSFDARDWAEAFCKTDAFIKCEIDGGMMIAWFSNALMRGYDEARALASCDGNPEGENPKGSSAAGMTARPASAGDALIEPLNTLVAELRDFVDENYAEVLMIHRPRFNKIVGRLAAAASALSSSKARIETLETALEEAERHLRRLSTYDGNVPTRPSLVAADRLAALRSKGETGDGQ